MRFLGVGQGFPAWRSKKAVAFLCPPRAMRALWMIWNSVGVTTGVQERVAIPVTKPIGLSLVPLPGLGDSRVAKTDGSAPAARTFLDTIEKFRTMGRMGI